MNVDVAVRNEQQYQGGKSGRFSKLRFVLLLSVQRNNCIYQIEDYFEDTGK
jgi:hypothetical protein